MNAQEISKVYQELYEVRKKLTQIRIHYRYNSRGLITKNARNNHKEKYSPFVNIYQEQFSDLVEQLINVTNDQISQLRKAAIRRELFLPQKEIVVPLSIAVLLKGKRTPVWLEEEEISTQEGKWLGEDEPWIDKGQWIQKPGYWYFGFNKQEIFIGHSQEEFEGFVFGVAYGIASLSENILAQSKFPDDLFT